MQPYPATSGNPKVIGKRVAHLAAGALWPSESGSRKDPPRSGPRDASTACSSRCLVAGLARAYRTLLAPLRQNCNRHVAGAALGAIRSDQPLWAALVKGFAT